MVKKQDKGDIPRKGDSKQKGKNKIWRVRLGGFLTVTVYDIVTWIGMGFCIGFALIYGFQGNKRGVLWSLVALLFLTLVMLGIRAKQHFWDEGKKEKSERPELSLERSLISFATDGTPQITLFILNRGQATAYKIELQGMECNARKSFKDRLTLLPNDVWDVYPNLAPGAGARVFSLGEAPLSEQKIKEIREGERLFFHCATGKYEDAAGNHYPFNHCFLFQRDGAGSGPVYDLSIAPIEYWPEEYCAEHYQNRK